MLAAGFILDLLFGDPEGFFHIVRLIGGLVSVLEKGLNKDESSLSLFFRGLFLVIAVLFSVSFVSAVILLMAFRVSRLLFIIIGAFASWQCLAVKCLKDSSMKVYHALTFKDCGDPADEEGCLDKARKALSMIVGRDTEKLDRTGVIRAAVESVAESTSDGVIAPLFFLMIFGPVGALFYKAANTMDSMIGYRNERYEFFGKAAARLDDILNYIPSRLSALLMVLVSLLKRDLSGRDALRVWLRDGNSLKSPNAGQTEAAASGALRLKLSGPAYYGNVYFEKPFIGAEFEREPVPEDIRRINSLMYLTAAGGFAVSVLLFLLIRGGFIIELF